MKKHELVNATSRLVALTLIEVCLKDPEGAEGWESWDLDFNNAFECAGRAGWTQDDASADYMATQALWTCSRCGAEVTRTP